jgi:5-methylcytosine-specific restriction endonuclease McrA
MPKPRAPRVTAGVVSKSDAKAIGLPRYFTGVPCIRGHLAERQVSNGGCLDCARVLGLETKRAGSRRRYHANKELVAKKYRAYYLKRRDYMLERTREYQRKHPEKVNFHSGQRTAMRRSAEGRYTAADIESIRKQQRSKCAVCRVDIGLRRESVDHIVALSNGGTNWPRNIQILCKPCNSRKKNKDPIVFMQQNGLLL